MEIEKIVHLYTKLIKMARSYFFLFLLFAASGLVAQDGALALECMNASNGKPLPNVLVEVHTDSLCLEGTTDSNGMVLFRGVPLGINVVWMYHPDKPIIKTTDVVVQANQVLLHTVFLNDAFDVHQAEFGRTYERSKDGMSGIIQTREINHSLATATLSRHSGVVVQEVQLMSITVQRKPSPFRTVRRWTSNARQRREERRKDNDGFELEMAEYEKVPVEEPFYIDNDRFLPIYENDFLSTVGQPNSTFGLDVDRASWTYVKERMGSGMTVQRDAVKLEEMINAFHYTEVDVPEDELFGVKMRRLTCPWNEQHELLTVHLKAMDLPKDLPRKKHNLVFLIDVSGSMSSADKLPLLVKGLKQMVNSLDEADVVSIVTYAGVSGTVLQPTPCDRKEEILNALDALTSGGSTNGIGGIAEAYRLAEANYDPEKNNRIILATDGDFNVGMSSEGDLEEYISEKRGKGIYLTALGFGMGNYKNAILETLADRGDGNHFYINDLQECQKVLVDGIGNILNLARDVKLNVEFNPEYVKEYRLIGYENRLLRPQDFEDDAKDAGEVGYGHEVTAVYEIVPGEAKKEKNHFVTARPTHNRSELAFVKLRYKPMEDAASVERNYTLDKEVALEQDALLQSVVALGLHLRRSIFKGDTNKELLIRLAHQLPESNAEVAELKRLILGLPQ